MALFDRALVAEELALVIDGQIGGTLQTGLEDWREFFFGSIENSGDGADLADADGDGESNLIEFATNQDPTSSSATGISIAVLAGEVQLRYTRSKAAMADGVSFLMEWSDDLQPNSWSTTDATEVIESEDSEAELILMVLPERETRARFLRLRVAR